MSVSPLVQQIVEALPAPRHIFQNEAQKTEMLSAQIAEHICEIWGWMPDEIEAYQLAENLVALLPYIVDGTRTQPSTLVSNLLHPVASFGARTSTTTTLAHESKGGQAPPLETNLS